LSNQNDFDRIAVVVDWLDACRRRDLTTLLDLYAEQAQLECQCSDGKIYSGRAELDGYWRPRLESAAPAAFELEAIAPEADGVLLDYQSFEGKPVRMRFSFDPSGKILQTRCEPVAAMA
jgi:hypothetical protein